MPYHIKKINKGQVGFISKIREELEELEDASEQNNKVMTIMELSDICAAISSYLENFHPSISLDDVVKMAKTTNSAFKDGTRRP